MLKSNLSLSSFSGEFLVLYFFFFISDLTGEIKFAVRPGSKLLSSPSEF